MMGFAAVFEPTLLAFVAGRHVALEPFGGRVVVVGRQHGLRKRITVLDDRRDALVDEPAFVMAQDPLTVEAEVPFRRGVDQATSKFSSRTKMATSTPSRTSSTRDSAAAGQSGAVASVVADGRHQTRAFAPDLLGFQPVVLDEPVQAVVRATPTQVEALRHLRRRPRDP